MNSKFIGIIRTLDTQGRITIPPEYRKFLGVSSGSKFTIVFNSITKEITITNLDTIQFSCNHQGSFFF